MSLVLVSACSKQEVNKLSAEEINDFVFSKITDINIEDVYTLDDSDYLIYIYNRDQESFNETNKALYLYLKNKNAFDLYGVDITNYDLDDYIKMIDLTKTVDTQTLFYVQEVAEGELVKRVVRWKADKVTDHNLIPEMMFSFGLETGQ